MKLVYAYFILNSYSHYSKSRTIGSLESTLYFVTFVLAQFLISISVLIAKLINTSPGKFILISLALTLIFHFLQRRLVTASFLSRYRKRLPNVDTSASTEKIIIMLTPSLLLALGLLLSLISIN